MAAIGSGIAPFKKAIDYLYFKDKNIEAVRAKLIPLIPKGVKQEEVIDALFNSRNDGAKILLCLEALQYELSPYDRMRKAIVEDTDHHLTHEVAMRRLQGDERQMAGYYDLAYRMNHPYIYQLASNPTPPDAYTLNFLWVNLNPQDRQKNEALHIFKDGLDRAEIEGCSRLETGEATLEKEKWEEVKKSFTYRISKWADLNPGVRMNLWYDSALVTQRAREGTFERMRAISATRKVNLQLRDIRQLPTVQGEIEHSLHPGTAVYYRVDLFKTLIADHQMTHDTAQYCVVSDIDIEPMPPQQMFDRRTIDYLTTSGYVFNRCGMGDFENSFFIFNREKENLARIHRETLIEPVIRLITQLRGYPINSSFKSEYILGAQAIYTGYGLFRAEMEDRRRGIPRKVVKCPRSQFNFGGFFSPTDYRSETFRFIGKDNVPYTCKGRSGDSWGERQIEALRDWKAQPL